MHVRTLIFSLLLPTFVGCAVSGDDDDSAQPDTTVQLEITIHDIITQQPWSGLEGVPTPASASRQAQTVCWPSLSRRLPRAGP